MILKSPRALITALTTALCAATALAQTYTNQPVTVTWPFSSTVNYATECTVAPEGTISATSFDPGVCTYKKQMNCSFTGYSYLVFQSKNGPSDIVTWSLKPAKGLTFTPTHISFIIGRDGTDGAGKDVTVTASATDGPSIPLASITPHRIGKDASQKFYTDATYTQKFDLDLSADQQAELTSPNGFNLILNNGYANSKGAGYSKIIVDGVVNGTAQSVEKYTLDLAVNPADAATLTANPNLPAYEAGSEIRLKADRNFGFRFVNWTDQNGNILATLPEYTHTLTANTVITANLEPIATHTVTTNAIGGNPYQIQLSPLPTVIDGAKKYETGTTVTATAVSNPVVRFTNWADGNSSSQISRTVDSDIDFTANFAAADLLAGWDFHLRGSEGRIADFANADNTSAGLTFRNAQGNTSSWLDKSQEAAGGYEGRPAAVNWQTAGIGSYYWQTSLNAEAYSDITVTGAFTYNYNAYTTQLIQASLNGTDWTTVGTVALPGAKKWADYTVTLPSQFNNAPSLHIRWISDTNSAVQGTSSANDGVALGATFITGSPRLINDGQAPTLIESIPADNGTDLPISGKIILSFNEKIKVLPNAAPAILNGKPLSFSAVGTTAIAEYNGLAHGTAYTLTIPGGTIADLTDNTLTSPITIKFTTRTRPEVAKSLYDFIVPDNGTFKQAIEAANTRADLTKRFTIFIKRGYYELPWSDTETVTGTNVNAEGVTYPSPITNLTAPNTSIIGEDRDATTVKNLMYEVTPEGTKYPIEGLKNVTTLKIQSSAVDTYIQDITLRNGMNDNTGRGEALQDNATRTICNNVTLWGYQDTYCSNANNGRYYFQGGILRGRTDYLCGKGDIFFNGVTLQVVGDGGYICAPSQPIKYGYVFSGCEIKGETPDVNGRYNLGRPWGKGGPTALYVNTTMHALPRAEGWAEMSGGWPARFAEFNSHTPNGSVVDLKNRKTTFADTHYNNPALTRAEADSLTIANVIGGDDNWDPTYYTEEAPTPQNVIIKNDRITWDDNAHTRLWAVCVDGNVVAFTTEPSVALSTLGVTPDSTHTYAVRAANEMGGLGTPVTATISSALNELNADSGVATYCDPSGRQTSPSAKGVLIKVNTRRDGTRTASKVLNK